MYAMPCHVMCAVYVYVHTSHLFHLRLEQVRHGANAVVRQREPLVDGEGAHVQGVLEHVVRGDALDELQR